MRTDWEIERSYNVSVLRTLKLGLIGFVLALIGIVLALIGFVLALIGIVLALIGFVLALIGFVLGLYWVCFHQVCNWQYFHNTLY